MTFMGRLFEAVGLAVGLAVSGENTKTLMVRTQKKPPRSALPLGIKEGQTYKNTRQFLHLGGAFNESADTTTEIESQM